MTVLYCASWVLPISSPPIAGGALAVDDHQIAAVGNREQLLARFSDCEVRDLGFAALVPGFINTHSHLELTAMRGLLDDEDCNFFAWLRRLTTARLRMTPEELYVSAAWGACEAVRAGVTCVGDSSDSAVTTMSALRDVGIRGTVFQESFGPDARLAGENLQSLRQRLDQVRKLETSIVRAGVSPHAPYTVSGRQLELISDLASTEQLPLMMHAAESKAEEMLLRSGTGAFADGLAKREIPWHPSGLSTVEYLQKHRILATQPLLAHCINVDSNDLQLLKETGSKVAHCPRSNAKLGHGRAPLREFLANDLIVGMGTDSVASNNSGDLLAETRFALLSARLGASSEDCKMFSAQTGLRLATIGGARALDLQSIVGELKEGTQADFVALSLAGNHQLPSYDPVVTLLFSSSGHDVLMTVVAGREIYVDGRVTSVDELALREAVVDINHKLQT